LNFRYPTTFFGGAVVKKIGDKGQIFVDFEDA
jgi:hypothetical protein